MSRRQPTPASAAPVAHYGPSAHHAWAQHAERISLVRHAPKPRPIVVHAEPEPIEIDLARTALVVIDMQNDFCHPEGWFAQKGIGVKPMRRPIPLLAQLLPAWRAAGSRVVWVNWGVRADLANLSPTVLFKGKRTPDAVGYGEASPIDRGGAVVRGTWGAQVVEELAVDPADICVDKHRLSGFWDNELDSVLRQQGITTLLFAGVNTDRCVFATLQDAAFLGYDCVLLADACSTPSPAYVTRAIHFLVRQLHGFVADAGDLVSVLPARTAPRRTSTPSSSPKEKA